MDSKDIKVRKALNQLRDEAQAEGNDTLAYGIEEFLHTTEIETLERFYDIIMVSETKTEALENLLDANENAVSDVSDDHGGFSVEQQVDGTYAVFQRGGFMQGGFREEFLALSYARDRADEYAEGLGLR